MDEIIKQIVQIDSVAVSNRKNNEQALKEKRERYEEEILTYREEHLKKANERAEELYKQIIAMGEADHHLEEEKYKKLALASQNRYLEVEEELINEVFDKLFRVEG